MIMIIIIDNSTLTLIMRTILISINKKMNSKLLTASAILSILIATPVSAGEHLLGYIKGAETMPEGAQEFYQFVTRRWDKGAGNYAAINTVTEYEWGVTNRFTASFALFGQSIDTSDLMIDGYVPGDENYGFKFSGIEASTKYNFLSPALDDFGLSAGFNFEYLWLDPHSGKDKDTTSISFDLMMQKYFLEGQLVWLGNLGLEATRAKRAEIDDLSEDFDWPTEAEMELELKAGTGLSYRFSNGWYAGLETLYEQERETEVDIERWSWFAGPSIHYANQSWWITVTWFEQFKGGGEQFAEQDDMDLHLIEKTKHELRFKFGYNF